jgi:hypothetical protein
LDLDFWPENRTLVKFAAAESDFGFGLGLRALPWEEGEEDAIFNRLLLAAEHEWVM